LAHRALGSHMAFSFAHSAHRHVGPYARSFAPPRQKRTCKSVGASRFRVPHGFFLRTFNAPPRGTLRTLICATAAEAYMLECWRFSFLLSVRTQSKKQEQRWPSRSEGRCSPQQVRPIMTQRSARSFCVPHTFQAARRVGALINHVKKF